VDPELYFEATFRNKVKHIGEWALSVPEGLLIVDRSSGHPIHMEQPAIVVEAIRRVVFPGIALQLQKALINDGIQSFLSTYKSLKRRYPADMFGEEILNSLGYQLLHQKRLKEAVAVFQLSVREYPNGFNPYDSLGDAYRAAGETTKAKESYRKSLKLNPQSPSGGKLKELEKEN